MNLTSNLFTVWANLSRSSSISKLYVYYLSHVFLNIFLPLSWHDVRNWTAFLKKTFRVWSGYVWAFLHYRFSLERLYKYGCYTEKWISILSPILTNCKQWIILSTEMYPGWEGYWGPLAQVAHMMESLHGISNSGIRDFWNHKSWS